MKVCTKGFGRPRAFRVEKARSAPIERRFAPLSAARVCELTACDQRMRSSKAFSVHARVTELAAQRLMIDALRGSYCAESARPPEAFRANFTGTRIQQCFPAET